MWKQKLGLLFWNNETNELLLSLLNLMDNSNVDYTIFWRQLAQVARYYQ
jgi:uncharacterized protein YdiU (UPF0061 family)